MNKIKVAIIGVGNCAKSLVEGIQYYRNNPENYTGLMEKEIGGFKVSDIEIVAAFDIDSRKVGKTLNVAINAEPNNTIVLSKVEDYNVVVQRGHTYDSVIEEVRPYFIHESEILPADIIKVLKDSNAEIVVNYLPTGSDQATFIYASSALEAGCSFINCMPTKLGRNTEWIKKFEEKGLVLMGDDIKSQLGATVLNKTLLELFKNRGIKVTQSDQTNFGGNADHFNLHFRPHSKEESKESALNSALSEEDFKPVARMIYTEHNFDHKRASIYVQGEMFGRSLVSAHVILDDEDSPNSGGVVVDAIRSAKCLINLNKIEEAKNIGSSFMKAPFVQRSEDESRKILHSILNIK